MVYSVVYYATEAITRAVIGFIFTVKEWLERRPMVERRKKEKPLVPRGYRGFLKVYDESGEAVYKWKGSSQLEVRIPTVIDPRIPALDITREKKPVRLHFLWEEAASQRWFEDIEAMAKLVEERKREGRSEE